MMKCQIKSLSTILTFAFAICVISLAEAEKLYEATWESLLEHEIPTWMEDAKFGIYAHWGPYSVAHSWDLEPGMNVTRRAIWFAKMYTPGSDERKLFEKHVGPITEGFGYKDLISQFKAENYDPVEWADLIAKSGAKYAGMAVVHHDGYGLWDSKIGHWNAGKTGPKRDIFGELAKELRKRDIRIVTSFHHYRTHEMWNTYFRDEAILKKAQEEGWDLLNPKYKDLYWYNTDFVNEYFPTWEARIKEVIDKYRPDVLWFDGGTFEGDASVEKRTVSVLAYYFNQARKWGKEVSVHNKTTGNWGSNKLNFTENFGVYSYEDGRDRPDYVGRPWEDDTSVGDAWPYYKGQTTKKPREVVVRLIDLVANNGGLLMSLTPKPDGTLPEEVKSLLIGIGEWLEQNGEAIFNTRTWKIRTEGDLTKLKTYQRKGGKIIHIRKPNPEKLTYEDIRFTRKGNILYAICTGIPPTSNLTIKTLAAGTKVSSKNVISDVLLLGSGEIHWKRDAEGLHLTLPEKLPNHIALAFEITVKGTLDL